MGVYEHGKRVAEQILLAQEIARLLKPVTEPPPTPAPKPPTGFVESPKPLSYYYAPYHYRTVASGGSAKIFDFKVPPAHVLHIELVGNSWALDSYFEWMVDGSLVERVERTIGYINNPVNIRHRYLAAYKSVLVVGYNKTVSDLTMEFLIDGTVYHRGDFERVIRGGVSG